MKRKMLIEFEVDVEANEQHLLLSMFYGAVVGGLTPADVVPIMFDWYRSVRKECIADGLASVEEIDEMERLIKKLYNKGGGHDLH